MDRRFGLLIFGGLVFGALVGMAFGSGSGNPLLSMAFGALFGVAIGWFAAAAALEKAGTKSNVHNENLRAK